MAWQQMEWKGENKNDICFWDLSNCMVGDTN